MANADTHDPKYVPSAAALSVVDIKVGEIRTDDALFQYVDRLHETEALTQARMAVCVFTARKRGHEFPDIQMKMRIENTKARELEKEGMAILRLGEVTRTTNAIRTGDLGIKVIDEITSKVMSLVADPVTGEDVDSRIVQMERLASGKAIQKKYVTADDKPLTDAQVGAILDQAVTTVIAKQDPLNAATLVKAVPAFSEEVGLKVKVEKRSPQDGGQSGPFGLEFHLKAALKDIDALEKASEGEPYVLTPADFKVLFDLVSRFGLALEPSEITVSLLDQAEKAGL